MGVAGASRVTMERETMRRSDAIAARCSLIASTCRDAQLTAEALTVAETNREKVLRGEVVRVSDSRLVEMQIQAVECEGVTANPVYHWHWAAVLNELVALRKIVAKVAEARGIDLGYSQSDAGAESG
jgi:hypothetical protein